MLHLLPRIFLSVLDPHSCAPPSQQYAGAVNILESRAAGVGWSLEQEQRAQQRAQQSTQWEALIDRRRAAEEAEQAALVAAAEARLLEEAVRGRRAEEQRGAAEGEALRAGLMRAVDSLPAPLSLPAAVTGTGTQRGMRRRGSLRRVDAVVNSDRREPTAATSAVELTR